MYSPAAVYAAATFDILPHHLQGCMYANGTIFPTYACDLKSQPNLTDPTQAPLAFSRGPPTPFTSGKIRLVPICALGVLL